MISIIICSIKPNLLAQVRQNIQKTIGIEHEIIVVDNRQTNYGVCKAYNLAAQQAQYDILCFSHEDLLFHTQNWGQNVLNHFKNPKIGLIGVLGSQIHPNAPAAWWDTTDTFIRKNLLQAYQEKASEIFYQNPDNQVFSPVISIDGLWFCCPKKIWSECKFDEKTFQEFHYYDHDFALQVGQKYQVGVIYDILIEHFSLGSLNESWIKNSILLHQKWAKNLPMKTTIINQKELENITFRIIKNFTTNLIEKNFDKKIIFPYAIKAFWLNPKDRQTHWFMVWLFQNYFPKIYNFCKKIWRKLTSK